MAQPIYSLSSIIPNNGVKQPRCATFLDDENFVMGFVDGTITSFEKDQSTAPALSYQTTPDSTHKIHTSIIYGINHVPEGHESLTETSLITGGGDKTIKNILSDGTELLEISPKTSPQSHTQPVEVITFGPDANKTLITAGWDGFVKFWLFGQCLLSFQYQNQYSTQFCSLGRDGLFVMGSANKNITMCKIDYAKLHQHYHDYLGAHSGMTDGVEDYVGMNDDEATALTAPTDEGLTLNDKRAFQTQVVIVCTHEAKAHLHAVRRIIPLYLNSSDTSITPQYFASIGNDGQCKIWEVKNATAAIPSFDLALSLDVIHGDQNQSEFLYDIIQVNSYAGNTDIIVAIACDDKTIRFLNLSAALSQKQLTPPSPSKLRTHQSDSVRLRYHSPYEISILQTPQTPRTLYTIPHTPHILVVTAGGAFVLTPDPDQYSNDEVTSTYNTILEASIEKAKKMNDIDIDSLPTAEVLFTPGTSDGQHKIVNIQGKAMAVLWSKDKFEWELVGEVMGSKNEGGDASADPNSNAGGLSMKKEHNGKYYDQIVDVDIGSGRMLKLPFNKDDDPWDIAKSFLEDNGLSQEAIMQVVQFIMPYIDQDALDKRKKRLEEEAKNQVSALSTTNWAYITRTTINIKVIQNALVKRINEFIEQGQESELLWPTAKLLQQDPALAHLFQVTSEAPNFEPKAIINQSDQDILSKILLTWPLSSLTPVLDMLRSLCCETTASNLLFNPSAATQPNFTMNTDLCSLINQKLTLAFQNSLVINDKQSFATLSLVLELYNNILGKRTAHRNAQAFTIMVTYFNTLFNFYSTVSNVTTGVNISSYVSSTENIAFGPKIMQLFVKFVYNLISCCNRMLQLYNTNAGFNNSVQLIIQKWILFLLNLYQQIVKTNGNTLPPEYNDILFEFIQMTCFSANAYKDTLKSGIQQNYLPTMQAVKDALFNYAKTLQNRAEQQDIVTICNDSRILFGTQ